MVFLTLAAILVLIIMKAIVNLFLIIDDNTI